jgi:N-acetylglucosaminyl-diphospho-decaprenol L-rhamnosyltransferase
MLNSSPAASPDPTRLPDRMDLSVVVVTYRSRAHVVACLDSVDRARAGLDAETLVVDNASDDGTVDLVRAHSPAVRVIGTGGNLGYAKAVNRGVQASSGEFVLVLNPDCVLEPGAVGALLGWLRAHPRCGIAGPRILNPDGSVEWSARSFPGPAAFLFNRYSVLTRLWPGNPWSRRYLLSDWDHASPRTVDWVSGAAMCVRRAAIAQAGGMDEAYFMFNEDVDWCHAMKDAGWSVDFVPAATVTHDVGASRSRVADRVILERHRGMLHYFRKYHRPHPLVAALVGALVMLRARVMLAVNARRS